MERNQMVAAMVAAGNKVRELIVKNVLAEVQKERAQVQCAEEAEDFDPVKKLEADAALDYTLMATKFINAITKVYESEQEHIQRSSSPEGQEVRV